jgi:hypothetical protein
MKAALFFLSDEFPVVAVFVFLMCLLFVYAPWEVIVGNIVGLIIGTLIIKCLVEPIGRYFDWI